MVKINNKLEKILRQVEKPARYVGGEINSIIKDKSKVKVRFAFCFPDTYEIGMSNLGAKILYSVLNEHSNYWCERVFTPWVDMREKMIEEDIPLYALESFDPLTDFDIIGFTLQYELSYTNILSMLDLGKIPLKSKDRTTLSNLVIAGGSCACNPEPLAEFIDLFVLGDGEEIIVEICDKYLEAKEKGITKTEFLKNISKLKGIYVPGLYDVNYNPDGTIHSIIPQADAPPKIEKLVINDLNKTYFPSKFVVPFIKIVHDRAVIEIMRGCVRGCRYCQAGFIYRPLREKDYSTLCNDAQKICESTGYDELSISSLSTSDYSMIEHLIKNLLPYTREKQISLSLPSLRIDNFSDDLLKLSKTIRKSSLTFAPEAATQHLRNVINKNITEEDIMKSAKLAFENGYTTVKLYFMMGLPEETDEDILAIGTLAGKIEKLFFETEKRNRKKQLLISVSVAVFVPKLFTPFQFEAQDTMDKIKEKQKLLQQSVKSKRIKISWHDEKTSFLEAVFARGDRRLSKVLLEAYKSGCHFDAWDELFDFSKWLISFERCGVDPQFYANRIRKYDEIFPNDHIDYGLKNEFLIKENQKAKNGLTTQNCFESCSNCGIEKYKGGVCIAKRIY